MHMALTMSAARRIPSGKPCCLLSALRQHWVATSSKRASVADCTRYITAIVEMSSLTEGRCVVQ